MRKQLRSILGLSVAVAFAWLAGNAGATTVRLHVDPAFNASGTTLTDPDLGWSANVEVDIAASCLSGPAGTCTGTLDSATGTLYDTNGTATTSDDVLLSSFGYTDTVAQTPFTISVAVDGSGHATGVDTSPIGYHSVFTGDLSPSFPGFSGNLWVEFYTGASEANVANLIIQALCPPIIDEFSWCHTEEECTPDPNGPGAIKSVDATYSITVVPEPESLWLVFAALSAGWLARRRKLH